MAARRIGNSVDSQIEDLECDIRDRLEYLLLVDLNIAFWEALDAPSPDDERALNTAIDEVFEAPLRRYDRVPDVRTILLYARRLLRNCVWVGINVPFPRNPTVHCERVIDTVFEIYDLEIYAVLRTEMIMANHHAAVLQRNWRRCITDPKHPACRRRLIREFEEISV